MNEEGHGKASHVPDDATNRKAPPASRSSSASSRSRYGLLAGEKASAFHPDVTLESVASEDADVPQDESNEQGFTSQASRTEQEAAMGLTMRSDIVAQGAAIPKFNPSLYGSDATSSSDESTDTRSDGEDENRPLIKDGLHIMTSVDNGLASNFPNAVVESVIGSTKSASEIADEGLPITGIISSHLQDLNPGNPTSNSPAAERLIESVEENSFATPERRIPLA